MNYTYEDTYEQIVTFIKGGAAISYCGSKVIVKGVEYTWQKPTLWIVHKNGAGYKAGYREVRGMKKAL